MLTFAFDAGGDDGTDYMTVAGFGSSTKVWDEFSEKWKARLDIDGIEFFHTVDVNNFRGPFRHWHNLPDAEKERLRKGLFKDLMVLIESHTFQKFSCTIVNADYQSTDNALRQEFAESAYSFAARACETHARNWAMTDGWKSCRNMKVAAIFEAGDGGQNIGKMRERLNKDYGHIPPTFRPKKDTKREDGVLVPGFVPLQAADWLAWEVNRAFKDFWEERIDSIDQMRWPMQEFLNRPSPYMTYMSSDELKQGDDVLSTLNKIMPLKDLLTMKKKSR